MFTELKYLSEAGGTANEDAVVCGEDYLVVIDAATGLEPFHFTEEATDARWFAKSLAELLDFELQKEKSATVSLTDILKNAAAKLQGKLDAFGYAECREGYPSACVSILRMVGERLEYLVLGDCPILLEGPEGVKLLYDDSVTKRDNEVVEWIKEQHRVRGISFSEARKEARGLLRKNRREMNRPDSYWIFEPTGRGVAHAMKGSMDAAGIQGAALLSDGFYEAYEVFGIAASVDRFYAMIKEQEPVRLLEWLRREQENGMESERACRLKERDDASLIWARVQLST